MNVTIEAYSPQSLEIWGKTYYRDYTDKQLIQKISKIAKDFNPTIDTKLLEFKITRDKKSSRDDILSFISKFKTSDKNGCIEEVFTSGYCYWFAYMLCGRFRNAILMYDPVVNHFVVQLDNRLFDITGDVTGQYECVPWSEYDDELSRRRIEECCINKTR